MFKILLKKQLTELIAFLFKNKKDNKARSKNSIVGLAIVLSLCLVIFAFMFFSVASAIGTVFLDGELNWLYFAIMGLMSILFGTFGSVFSTYTSLYKAKDNEILLSMPIKPITILEVRMFSVYVVSFVYTSIIWIPTVISYFIFAESSAIGYIFPIIATFLIPLFVTVISCLLGWIVGLIASKIKKKSFITVIFTLGFFAIYYYFTFNLENIIDSIIQSSGKIGDAISVWAYPVYLMGKGAAGDVLSMALFTLMVFALFAICCLILSKTFIKIVTTEKSAKKTVYTGKKEKSASTPVSLFKRELKHFTSSPTYMLNCGLGAIIIPIVAIVLAVKSNNLTTLSETFEDLGSLTKMLPPIFASLMCVMLSMNAITAPSVSLEGKSLWIIRSLPVDGWDVLKAKERLHIVINTVPAVIATLVIGIAYGFGVIAIILMLAMTLIYVLFTADLGLWLNLKKPNLDWSNESVPIKQSTSVIIVLFGGWGISLVLGGLSLLAVPHIGAELYLLGCCIVLTGITLLLRNKLRTRGTKMFEEI